MLYLGLFFLIIKITYKYLLSIFKFDLSNELTKFSFIFQSILIHENRNILSTTYCVGIYPHPQKKYLYNYTVKEYNIKS